MARSPQARIDLALAIVLLTAAQASIWSGTTAEGPKALAVPVAVVVTLGLAWRRRAPALVAGIAAGGWLLQAIAGRSPSATWELIALVVYAYSLAAYQDSRPAILSGAAFLVVMWVVVLLDPTQEGSGRLFTAPVIVGLPWFAGYAVRRYSSQARRLMEANRELAERRREAVQAATREERARIARELHDIVAHSLSVMVVQAGAAEEMLAHDPTRAAEPLAAIRRTGKGALAEMRRLLGVLRTDAEGLALAPQPGIRDLRGLVDQIRATGLDVRLAIADDLPPLASGADLVAYRVVQESLTNALKHAGPVSADVRLAACDGAVEIEVTNPVAGDRRANGPGHGLDGMRERLALYGGSLTAGSTGGCWRVHARLPLDTEPGP